MGRIITKKTDRFGNESETEIRTNKVEDVVLEVVQFVFGRETCWRLVHRIERWKLGKR